MSVNVRKLIKIGCSHGVVIPPHVQDHIHAEPGDFIALDISSKNFIILSLAPVPPYNKTQQPRVISPNEISKTE